MSTQVIKTFVAESGKAFSFDVDVPANAGQLVLVAQAQHASTNPVDFTVAAGEAWTALAGETLAGTNRRYRGGVWTLEAPAAGALRIEIACGRPSSLMAFVMAVEKPLAPEAPRRHELSVVVRPLAAGEAHEVRYVRPEDVVMKAGGGIDWERTAFRGHTFVIEEGE